MANWIGKVKNDQVKGEPSEVTLMQGTQQKLPKPIYKSFLFWLALLVGAGVAGPATRGYRYWQEAEANLPNVSDALTFERTGTITI